MDFDTTSSCRSHRKQRCQRRRTALPALRVSRSFAVEGWLHTAHMSDYPNPYGVPETVPQEPNAEDELARALQESLQFQEREAREREEREAAMLEEAMQASKRESTMMPTPGDEDEQLRAVLEHSRREAFADERRREAERQRHALLELDVIEQSRMEHERRMRASTSSQRIQNTVSTDQESLLWLESPNSNEIKLPEPSTSTRQSPGENDLAFLMEDPAFSQPQSSQQGALLHRGGSWPNPFDTNAAARTKSQVPAPTPEPARVPAAPPNPPKPANPVSQRLPNAQVGATHHSGSQVRVAAPINVPSHHAPNAALSPQPRVPSGPLHPAAAGFVRTRTPRLSEMQATPADPYAVTMDDSLFMPTFPATPIARPHSSNAQNTHDHSQIPRQNNPTDIQQGGAHEQIPAIQGRSQHGAHFQEYIPRSEPQNHQQDSENQYLQEFQRYNQQDYQQSYPEVNHQSYAQEYPRDAYEVDEQLQSSLDYHSHPRPQEHLTTAEASQQEAYVPQEQAAIQEVPAERVSQSGALLIDTAPDDQVQAVPTEVPVATAATTHSLPPPPPPPSDPPAYKAPPPPPLAESVITEENAPVATEHYGAVQEEQSVLSPSSSSSSLVLHERPYPLENADGQPALRGVQFGWAANAFSLELYAQPQGLAHLYPVPELEREPVVPAPQGSSADDPPYSVYFPGSVRLARVETGATAASLPWFVLRAYSWRILLRALAWYGKTIVSGQVNDTLHIETGFVIPRKSDTTAPAMVTLAMCTGIPAQQRVRWEALEAYSNAGGSTLTTVSLVAHQLALPTDLVTLAQSLHSAPHLSNAPALRELKQAITKQDEFLEHRSSHLSSLLRSRMLTPVEELELSFLNNQLTLQADPMVPGSEAPKEDVDGGGHREYLLHRMRRRLARWQSSIPDEDELATWVTPFDLRQS